MSAYTLKSLFLLTLTSERFRINTIIEPAWWNSVESWSHIPNPLLIISGFLLGVHFGFYSISFNCLLFLVTIYKCAFLKGKEKSSIKIPELK